MRAASRPTDGKNLNRWLPLLERLEQRETPAVTAALSQVANWADIGPNLITNGQVRNVGANNAAIGAVQALAFDPTDVNTLFAGSPNGGIWRTFNANAASPIWNPISDAVASLSIADIAIDPDNPDRLVAAIGATADGWQPEGGTTQRIRGDLVGLLYTENARAANPTWRFLSNNLAGKNVTNVFIRTGYILAATDQGMFRSTDNGVTFSNIYPITLNNGISYSTLPLSQGVYDLAENPRLRNQFYLATKPGGAFPNNEIWRTDDGGATWGRVTDTFEMQLNARTVNVQLTVRDTGAFDNQIYVAVTNNNPVPAVVSNFYDPGPEQATPGVGLQYGWENRLGVLTSITWSTNQGGDWTRMDAPRQLTDPDPLDYGVRDPDGRANGVAVKNVGGGADVNSGVVTIITRMPHRLRTGDRVFVRGLFQWEPPTPPNPNPELVNGFFRVTVTGPTRFTLDDVTLSVTGLDSTRGYWQRVVGANPGERGEFLQLAASNLLPQQDILLGGDFSQFKFEDFSDNAAGSGTEPFGIAFGDPNIPTYPGLNAYYPGLDNNANPVSFTGSVWRGNRFTNPTDPFAGAGPGNSSQWATITDGGTPGLSSPGGDTREMLVNSDGGGNTMLWVATGTGIYRRTLNTNSNWTSANGNIEVGQFWSAAYDSLNNVVAGATQDTGAVESGASSNTYTGITPQGQRNALTDQEYSYTAEVDNTSTANRGIRYYAGSNFQNVRRRVFDQTNTLVAGGETTLNFANSFTTTAAMSGITTQDLNLAQDPSARIIMSLNRFDARRGIYGLTSVYEDSDPNGVTGFIVNNVTPTGMTGRVSAMAYGGRRAGVNFNQILYVGTSTGQLWLRGEFGVTFSNVAPVPGGGAVTDVEMDPDDWRRAFVVQGGRVYETQNAGVNWTEVSVGLVTAPDPVTGLPSPGGLTTQIRSIALFDPNPGTANVGAANDVIVLAGGRGGVYRRTRSVCGDFVWSEYGTGMPNSVVTDLQFDSTGVRLIAATFGRGVWSVPDVTPTLTQTLFLDIVGDAAANNISITSDPLDPNTVIVSDGLGLNARFAFGQFDAIRIFGQGGADTVSFASGVSNGNLQYVAYPVSIDMGGDAGDRIIINDSTATTNVQVTVDATTIGNGTGDNIFDGCGTVTYSGLQNGVLTLLTGSGNDSIILANGVLPPTVELAGGAGDDTYSVNSSSTTNVFISDTSGNNAVGVTMPPGQTAYVDAANRTLVAGGLTVTATPGVNTFSLNPTAPSASVVWTASNGSDSAFLMQDSLPGWSRLALNGFVTRFHNMSNVTANMLGGADALQVDSNGPTAGGTTQFVNYLFTANMGGDLNDTLLIDSSGSAAAISAGINGTTVGTAPGIDTLFGGSGYLNYTGLANGIMDLRTGSGNDRLNFSAAATLRAVVTGGGGNDQMWMLGTTADDVAVAYNNSLRANAMNLVATFGVEQYGFAGNGGSDQVYAFGTTGTDALTIAQLGLQSATIGGIVVPITYLDVRGITLEGIGGNDSLAWTDASNTAYGSAINPTAGLVYAPTGSRSGILYMGGGAGSALRFMNVGGTFTANGDPTGSATRDVFTFLGVSSASAGSANGETTAANGSDTIAATDAGVTITNASLGGLKGVSFGQTPGGFLGFSTVLVRGGNEAGTGDTFTATTTTRTNLLLDGGAPTAAPGDTLTITTNGPAATTSSSDPNLGPPHTRVTSRADQSSVGYLNFEQVSALTPDPNNPGGPPIPSFGSAKSDLFAVGSDAGAASRVRVYNLDGSLRFDLSPFGGFTGGVRVAVGDVTGDGKSDIVVAAGPGGGPIVKVYDGKTGVEVRAFYAYDPSFTGGVSLAVGNFNSDAFADIVTGAGAGGGPHVRLWNGASGAEIYGFFAYAPNFTGGVNVGAGDVTGDGLADIITGTLNGAPHVKAFNGQTLAELASFFAFDPSFAGGVNVAAGDITNDGRADIIVGAGQGGATQVRVFDAVGGAVIRDFVVNDPTIPGTPPINVTGGVRVAAADFDGDGLTEIVTGRGRGSRPFAQVLKVSTLVGTSAQPSLTSLMAVNVFGDAYSNGIYVGA